MIKLLSYLNILKIPIKKGYLIDLKGNQYDIYQIDMPYGIEEGDIMYINVTGGFERVKHFKINMN